jgi:hypothetical protein
MKVRVFITFATIFLVGVVVGLLLGPTHTAYQTAPCTIMNPESVHKRSIVVGI